MARQRDNKGGSSGEKSTSKQKSGKQQQQQHNVIENADSTKSSSTTTTSTTSSTAASETNKPPKGKHPKKATFEEPTSKFVLNKWKTLAGSICMAVAAYFCYQGYLETRVNTPFDNQKMVTRAGLDDPERYWGSYRPLNYFGMKTRDPHSLVMGLMWYTPSNLGHGGKGIRHWCDMGDNLDKYGWTHHDGRTFGVQEIHDLPFELKTSFVKYPSGKQFGGDWTARISVKNTTRAWDRSISLIWYVALDERTNGHIKYVSDEKSPEPGVYGETLGLGEFQLRFHPVKGRILHKSYLSTVAPSLSKLKETVFSHFRAFTDKKGHRYIGLPGEMISHNGQAPADPNFIAIQITAEVDFTLDITYQSTSGFSVGETIPKPPTGRDYTDSLQSHIAAFDKRFEDTFHLKAKGFSNEEIKFAKYALSNMLGGIGYFYGSSKVQSVYTTNPVPYWKSALYTAVPSRSFFPRGFLWDEGFHGLLISSWDIDIELDIISHWFDLLNIEGWIPREQILGVEALAKVPDEFVIQRNTNANPPTFLLTLKKILKHHKQELSLKSRLDTLERIYPRLQAWFAWYNTTQRGDIPGTYQWRGRDATTERELNPKTLSSGLDDFPRSSHPSSRERHVDIRCWMAFAASVMAELSTILGKDDHKYYETAGYLKDNDVLNEQHLSPYTETYADWGLHSDSVVLKRPQLTQKNLQRNQHQQMEMVRVTLKQPDYKFVDSTFGYVNIFPFLLEILDHDSPYLGKLLKDIRDPQKLWTPYGLRSLSKSSPLYQKRNTEHDPPYWRGPIWININYLAVKALRYYGMLEGPYAALARDIYAELRENLIHNIFKEFQRTGYLWEQYDDTTGQGKGCYPFTGWSSLVVLIMSEQY
ncbi:mannosyl-oligosaccharide glucosidase [Musca vetustissima]|uniref:mannosyl-oligosaccharide glucosidase n=1 Tax=Musca vetustissima TaxID=27455 RepID=UPI002AB62084|nr:mannosyl-oligosaccharide glucosidase [Musca vetustissima]